MLEQIEVLQIKCRLIEIYFTTLEPVYEVIIRMNLCFVLLNNQYQICPENVLGEREKTKLLDRKTFNFVSIWV